MSEVLSTVDTVGRNIYPSKAEMPITSKLAIRCLLAVISLSSSPYLACRRALSSLR